MTVEPKFVRHLTSAADRAVSISPPSTSRSIKTVSPNFRAEEVDLVYFPRIDDRRQFVNLNDHLLCDILGQSYGRRDAIPMGWPT